jgi:hypothetical protein
MYLDLQPFLILFRGWTQTSINTSGLAFAREYGLQVDVYRSYSTHDVLWFSVLGAAPFLFGSVLGLVLNDILQYLFKGRKRVLLLAGMISLASFIGRVPHLTVVPCCLTDSYQVLRMFRVLKNYLPAV